VFGVGYGTASLGCTLPLFLAVAAQALAARGAAETLGALGMVAAGAYLVYYQFKLGGL